MSTTFFENPILNSPYELPQKHWKTDSNNRPTGEVASFRRPSSLRSPIPAPGAGRGEGAAEQMDLFTQTVEGVDYRENDFINQIRGLVGEWRKQPREKWGVTPETARLLEHWRHYDFASYRPFFCQVEAVETLIWLTEVAPREKRFRPLLETIAKVNAAADPALFRMACKLATGAGKTTVMAMVIAWQTINAAHHGVSEKFTNGFLVCTPGITIRDRLQVLLPNDTDSYYKSRQLVPVDYLPLLGQARIVITNYHAFMPRSTMTLSAGTRRMLVGPSGAGPQTVETEGQMLRRVMPELLGLKSVLVINDEAHHCYRHRPETGQEAERALDADEKAEAKENEEAARVWISGLEALRRLIPSTRVFDLSATPFFLRGSGYQEGTLFPWTVSDFSLMDALECGIVKLPRIPITDDMTNAEEELPVYRDLWKNIREKMPKKGRGKGGDMNPENLPNILKTAIELLYKDYETTFQSWKGAGYPQPPCFIFVCQNTTISKLVFDYVSGYVVKGADGSETTKDAACPLFSNFDPETGVPLPMPRTLLIDSMQLESGEALGTEFRAAASPEIEAYKRELVNRTGDRAAADKITDEELLREVMNTVGKEGRLGGQVRCVVSVSMLTEGWDANTVTHILGVRAFGTQLLCEQVVGRALRRLSYDPDAETGHFRPESANIFGVPFDFASKGIKTPPPPPPDVVRVRAVHPERDALSICFPRVQGYYLEQDNPKRTLRAKFDETSALAITKKEVGPTKTLVAGFVGPASLLELGEPTMRRSSVVAKLAARFIDRFFSERLYSMMDRQYLFVNAKRLFTEWMDQGYLRGLGEQRPDFAVMFHDLRELACDKLNDAIVRDAVDRNPETSISVQLDDFQPTGSTDPVNFIISRNSKILHETREDRCPVNYAVCDTDWERMVCEILEAHPATISYARNYNLAFQVPYVMAGERHDYIPDFLVLLDDGHGPDNPLHLVLEVKGYRYLDADVKKATMRNYWIPGVNKLGNYGRWAFWELDQDAFGFGAFTDPESRQALAAKAYGEAVEEIISHGDTKTRRGKEDKMGTSGGAVVLGEEKGARRT